jgi:hypothetical protein
MQDIQDQQTKFKQKHDGRNKVEEYWKVKPISFDQKEAVYKSSDNIVAEKRIQQ